MHVVLGVSGGIACYKSCTLARRLTEANVAVDVVLTAAAAEFIRPVTFEALTGRPVLTSLWDPGRALAHLDLALWILRQHSPSLAGLVARYLVVDERASQAAYVIPDHLAHADPLIERFEQWARSRLAQGFSLTEAARTVGASERTLARRLHRVLGKTPLSYFQDLRIEHAVHRLQTGTASVDAIASEVGYADGVTLRTLLRRKLGRGVRELRRQQTA